MITMKAEQLSNEMKSGGVQLIDVRTPAEYRSRHIDGSQLMPLGQLQPQTLEGKECVIICQSGKRAEMVRKELEDCGARGLRVLEGGIGAWEALGYPLERGKSVISLERQTRLAIGTMVLSGLALGVLVHPGFLGISAFAGAGLMFAGLTDWCGLALLLAKAPWNQEPTDQGKDAACSV